MCGILWFTILGIFCIFPFKIPSPWTFPSSLDSKSSWRPKHIPKKDFPLLIQLF